MSGIILIFLCLLTGILLQRIPAFPLEAHKGLNGFLIYISLPAITLRYLPDLDVSAELLFPVGMAWLVFGLAWITFDLIGKWRNWPAATIGCLVLVAGLGNTSFVGFPLIRAFYGEEGLQLAVLCDQPGSFLVLSTLGILAMSYYLTGKWEWRSIGGEMLRFPPFLAFLIVLPMMIFSWRFPEWVRLPLETLGSTLTPIAMVSIGLQLKNPFRQSANLEPLGWGLLSKLLIAPVTIAGLYIGLFQLTGLVAKVSVLEAAMAPMVTPSIIAMEKNLNPPLASLLIAVGIPTGIGTVYGWYWIVEHWL